MNLKLDRIISIATLVAALIAIVLVLKRPAPVAAPQAAPSVQQAQSGDASPAGALREQSTPFSGPATVATTSAGPSSGSAPAVSQPQPTGPSTQAAAKPDAGVNSEQVSSAIAKMLGGGGGLANLTPDSNAGSGDPVIKDQQVTMDGDIVHGKFLTTIAGKDVWVTISGHMGEKDGYATFDPTEFKVGDMEVPVSLVNPALQRKLAEERDRLKIPNNNN
jgi:cytoskeletal protein RodZ